MTNRTNFFNRNRCVFAKLCHKHLRASHSDRGYKTGKPDFVCFVPFLRYNDGALFSFAATDARQSPPIQSAGFVGLFELYTLAFFGGAFKTANKRLRFLPVTPDVPAAVTLQQWEEFG